MTSTSAYHPRVMISSAMKGFGAERASIAHDIEAANLIPWYAENPPEEFRGVTGETLSFEMAARCDLYLLIIFSRYGSQVFADDTRSVTHQEYLKAREANPRKVRVFIAADALEHADSPELQAFIAEVNAFQTGYVRTVFQNLADLETALHTELARWQRDGQSLRDAYVQTVRSEYQSFRNPVTGREMDYGATVLLTLRAQVHAMPRRLEWGNDDVPGRHGSGGSRGRQERRDREPIAEVVKAPPQVATDLLAQHQHLVVLGDVGAGKSTLLKRLAHDAAESYTNAHQTRIPILVTATRLGALAARYPTDPLAEVVGRLQEEDTRFEALRPTVRATVSDALARGEALLLVDGLDEANAAEQTNVFRLLSGIGANQALLAARPAAYSGQLAGWQVADLQQLGGEKRRELIVRVFRAELDDSAIAHDDTALAHDAVELEEALRARQADLAAWAGNPLLLTLIAVQFTRDRRLPESRARIYAFAIEDLQRQRPPTARRYLTQEELEHLTRLLSLRMTEALRRSATVAEVRDNYLHAELAADYLDMPLRSAVAREVLERSGVLQGDATSRALNAEGGSNYDDVHDRDQYEYVHLSFREYLTACALAEMPPDKRCELAVRHCLHQQWEQVLLLLVSRLDASGQSAQADGLIRELLAADHQQIVALGSHDPTHIALRMASRCALARGKVTDDRLFREVQRAWSRVWRAEERRNRIGIVSSAFFGQLETMYGNKIPTFLREGVPLVLGRIMPRRRLPNPRQWIYALRAAPLAALLLYVVGQVTMGIPPLAHSGWGRWVQHILPICVLAMLGFVAALRLCARRTLVGQMRLQMLNGVLHEDDAARLQAFGQLEARAPIEQLLAALRKGDADVRNAAVSALGQLGAHAPIDALVALLREDDAHVREAAVRALGLSGARTSIEPLLAALSDAVQRERRASNTEGPRMTRLPIDRWPSTAEAGVWIAAQTALEQVSAHGPIEPLLAALRDGDDTVRKAAARVLGQLGERAPVGLLVAALREEDPAVRQTAATALGQLGERAPVEPLIDALRDADSSVRRAAAMAVGRLGDQAVAAAARQLGDQALVEPLLATLSDPLQGDRREAAVAALGRLGAHAPIETLVALLEKRDSWDTSSVRKGAVEALRQLGDRAPVESLLVALRDRDVSVAMEAANALGRLGDHAPIEELVALLLDQNVERSSYARELAAQALGQLGDRAPVEPLLAALRDADFSVRRGAAKALGQLGAHAPIEPLVTALRDWNDDVRKAAAQALGQLGDRAPIESLVAALGDEDPQVRQEAATALGARELPLDAARRLVSKTRPLRWWVRGPIRVVQRLTDWPVLLAVMLAQVVLLAPALSRAVPLPGVVRWLFGLTAWWQVLLVAASYGLIYGVIIPLAREFTDYSEYFGKLERVAELDAVESVIRRQVADTWSATLATNEE